MNLLNIKKIIKYFKIFSIFLIFFSIISVSEAVSLNNGVNIKITPNFPGPNQEVSISIEEYSMDINMSEISWFKNGVLVKKGVGEKNFSFITGDIGTTDS